MLNRVTIAAALTLTVASVAAAQTSPQAPTTGSSAQTASGTQTSGSSQTTGQTSSSMNSSDVQTRPATTTFMGDTGLWNVPTGEVDHVVSLVQDEGQDLQRVARADGG